MEASVIINRQPKIKSLVSASRYILLRMRFVKILCVSVLFISITNLQNKEMIQDDSSAVPNWISYGVVVLIWILILYRLDFSMRKQLLANPKTLEPQKLSFTSTGFISEGLTYKIEYPWQNILKIKETKRWFLIYISKISAIPIEKENLTEKEYSDLKELLDSLNVKKQFRLLQQISQYSLLGKAVSEKKAFQRLSIRFHTENMENISQ